MADKMRLFLTGLFIILFCQMFVFQTYVFAQTDAAQPDETAAEESSQLNYYIDRSEGEPRFIQRLIWQEANFAFRYEVIVQRQQPNGSFTEAERISTENAFAEVSLPAGRYRYQVNTYDLVDEFSFSTSWREFDIIRAIQPELSGFSPSVFYLDEDKIWEITVRGYNFLEQSEIYLVDSGRIIRPQSRVIEETTALLVFSGVSLSTGKFDIYVRNPGGLDAQMGTFTIANKKPFDFNISLGYAPAVPLYGYLFKDADLEAPFPDSVYLLGAVCKISFVPVKRIWGNLGIEASASFTNLEHEREYYSTHGYLLNTHLSFLYQIYFFNKFAALGANLGAGLSTLTDFHYAYPVGEPTDLVTNIIPSAIAGLSLKVFAFKPFFLSAGADFIHAFSVESPMPGFLRPFFMAGIQF